MRTSYADNAMFPFSRVFRPPHQCGDVFQPLLPVVLDCINGINGAIVVSALPVLCCGGLHPRVPISRGCVRVRLYCAVCACSADDIVFVLFV